MNRLTLKKYDQIGPPNGLLARTQALHFAGEGNCLQHKINAKHLSIITLAEGPSCRSHLTRLPCDVGRLWEDCQGEGRCWGWARQAEVEEQGQQHNNTSSPPQMQGRQNFTSRGSNILVVFNLSFYWEFLPYMAGATCWSLETKTTEPTHQPSWWIQPQEDMNWPKLNFNFLPDFQFAVALRIGCSFISATFKSSHCPGVHILVLTNESSMFQSFNRSLNMATILTFVRDLHPFFSAGSALKDTPSKYALPASLPLDWPTWRFPPVPYASHRKSDVKFTKVTS